MRCVHSRCPRSNGYVRGTKGRKVIFRNCGSTYASRRRYHATATMELQEIVGAFEENEKTPKNVAEVFLLYATSFQNAVKLSCRYHPARERNSEATRYLPESIAKESVEQKRRDQGPPPVEILFPSSSREGDCGPGGRRGSCPGGRQWWRYCEKGCDTAVRTCASRSSRNGGHYPGEFFSSAESQTP